MDKKPPPEEPSPQPASRPEESSASPTKESNPAEDKATSPPVKKKRRPPEKPWKKPKDMPKRPLSAYNLFFKEERARLIAARGKASLSPSDEASTSPGSDKPKRKHVAGSGLGFSNLAKTVAAKWKELDPATKAPFEERAAKDKARYGREVAVWRTNQKKKNAPPDNTTMMPPPETQLSPNPRFRDPAFAPTNDSQSVGSIFDTYPSDWFEVHTDPQPHQRVNAVDHMDPSFHPDHSMASYRGLTNQPNRDIGRGQHMFSSHSQASYSSPHLSGFSPNAYSGADTYFINDPFISLGQPDGMSEARMPQEDTMPPPQFGQSSSGSMMMQQQHMHMQQQQIQMQQQQMQMQHYQFSQQPRQPSLSMRRSAQLPMALQRPQLAVAEHFGDTRDISTDNPGGRNQQQHPNDAMMLGRQASMPMMHQRDSTTTPLPFQGDHRPVDAFGGGSPQSHPQPEIFLNEIGYIRPIDEMRSNVAGRDGSLSEGRGQTGVVRPIPTMASLPHLGDPSNRASMPNSFRHSAPSMQPQQGGVMGPIQGGMDDEIIDFLTNTRHNAPNDEGPPHPYL